MLSPDDFGLIAIAMAYIGFIQMLTDQGLGQAIIQREDLQPRHLDTAFTATMTVMLVLTIVGVASAGWWAQLNNSDELRQVIWWLSAIIPLSGLNIMPMAVLRRGMEYKKLGICGNVSVFAGGATGITMALMGYGAWSLVGQRLVSQALAVLLYWSACTWRPGLRIDLNSLRELMGYSLKSLSQSFASFVGVWSAMVVLGLYFGPAAVGLYQVANKLRDVVKSLFAKPMIAVAFPQLSKHQNNYKQLIASMSRLTHASTVMMLPSMAILAVLADRVMLAIGPQWADAANALRLLCVTTAGVSAIYFSSPLLNALDKAGTQSVMLWSVTGLNVLGCLVAATFAPADNPGAQATTLAAVSAAIMLGLVMPATLIVITRTAKINTLRLLIDTLPGTLAGIVAGVVAWLINAVCPQDWPPLLVLALAGGTSNKTPWNSHSVIQS